MSPDRSRRRPSFLFVATLLVFAVGVAEPPAAASPPEVADLAFDDDQTLSWAGLAGAVGYHVYRGDAAGLPGSFGACRVGSVTSTFARVDGVPASGSALTYLVSAFDEGDEGTLGTTSDGETRVPDDRCVTARRVFPIETNGTAPDGVEDGVLAQRNARTIVRGWDPFDKHTRAAVVAATGELVVASNDLRLRGRGLDWSLERTYRSQVAWNGPFGRNWFFADGEHLRRGEGGAIVHCDAAGRCATFAPNGPDFRSPDGVFAVLHAKADGSFALRHPDGTIVRFDGFGGTATDGALRSIEDRFGNVQRCLYDHQGLLTNVVDSLGRAVTYEYDALGRVVSVRDGDGREVVFGYDADDRLVSVRSPTVTGTPTGNDFPAGKTTSYSYSSGFADARLDHNLLTITDARGQTWLTNTYSSVPDDPDVALTFDRVVQQQVGGTNASGVPAGGTVTFSYESLNAGATSDDPDLKRRRAVVTDPNGNVTEHELNYVGHELTHVAQTRGLRPDDPPAFRTERRYDANGLLQQVDFAEGGSAIYTYDDAAADRYRGANLLEVRYVADPARGDGHGGDQPDVVTSYDYEPLYNRVRSYTDPRGNDSSYVPPNGGEWSSARYTTSWRYDYQEGDPDLNGVNAYAAEWGISLEGAELGVGDLNGDGILDVALGVQVVREDPTVHLDPAGDQVTVEGDDLQEIVTTWQHNEFGQLVAEIDPTGVETTYTYHPETDPDGDQTPSPAPLDGRALSSSTGGYRASTTDGAGGRAEYLYDARGNLTDFVDPRGVRHVFVHNELDQVVEERVAAATSDSSGPSGDPATGYGESGLTPLGHRTLYLYDANDNLAEVREEDRGDTRGLGGWLVTTHTFDALDRVVATSRQPRSGTTLVGEQRYDGNGNTTRLVQPGGNETHALYDERDLLLELTLGAAGPFGGTPAVTSYSYDANGNVTRVVDPAGEETTFEYDGVDRLVRRVDRVGGVHELYYDPASNVVQSVARGTVGGPSPTDRSGAGNVVLSDARFEYDEMNRPIRRDLVLGMPSGSSPARTPVLQEGSLDPADGLIGRLAEYDAAGRATFLTSDHGATHALNYDARGWLAAVEQPDGSEVVQTHDAAGNLIETESIDLDSVSGRTQSFLTTFFYDALGRRTMSVDEDGRAHRFVWDSLSDVVQETDPNGPPGGTIARRSPAHSGEEIPINDHGNLTEYAYDGLSRLTSTRRVLTASGAGDGTTDPTPDTSNPYNPSGEIRRQLEYDANSRLIRAESARGDAVTYAYDNLDRRTQATYPDATTSSYSYDAAGNLVQLVDPAGSTFDLGYDAAHRPIRMDIVPAPGLEGTTLQTFQYDGLGRVTRATDQNAPGNPEDDSEVTFFYDLLGRLVEEQQRVPGVATARAVGFGYLGETLVSRLTLPSDRQIEYAYDPAGRLIRAADSSSTGGRVDFEHVGMERITRRLAGSGLETRVSFDALARVSTIRHEHTGTLLSGWEYDYEPGGRLHARLRTHAASGDLTPGTQFEWDSAGRIVSAVEGEFLPDLTLSGPANDEISSLLDAEGNEPEITWNGTTYAATPNNLDRYDEDQCCGTSSDDGLLDDFLDPVATPDPDGRNFAHDAAGRQTNTDARKLVYDALGRPVEVLRDGGATTAASYAYDALNRQARRDVTPPGGSLERFVYHHAGHRVIEERTQAGELRRQVAITPSGAPLWQLRDLTKPSPTAEHLLTTATGSVGALVTHDGTVLERMTYGTRGVPTLRDAAGAVKVDGSSGAPIARSEFGVRELLHGLTYLPELGVRSADANADWGGGYLEGATVFDPNQAKTLSSPGFSGPTTHDDTGTFGMGDIFQPLPSSALLEGGGGGGGRIVVRAINHNTTRSNRVAPSTYEGGRGGGPGGHGGTVYIERANNHNSTRSHRDRRSTYDGGRGGGSGGSIFVHRANNHNTTRSNRVAPSTFHGGRGGGGGGMVLRANNHNSTRSNRISSSTYDGGHGGSGGGGGDAGVARANNHNTTRSNRVAPATYDGGRGGGGGGGGMIVLRANNHNTTRSNRTQLSTFGGGGVGGGGSSSGGGLGYQGRLFDKSAPDSGLSKADAKRALDSFIHTSTGARSHRPELIEAKASTSGLSKADSKRALNGFINTTTRSTSSVASFGDGAFAIGKREARKGRNPQTGKEIKIAAKNCVRFKAGADLSSSVRGTCPGGPPTAGPAAHGFLGVPVRAPWLPLLPAPKFGPR